MRDTARCWLHTRGVMVPNRYSNGNNGILTIAWPHPAVRIWLENHPSSEISSCIELFGSHVIHSFSRAYKSSHILAPSFCDHKLSHTVHQISVLMVKFKKSQLRGLIISLALGTDLWLTVWGCWRHVTHSHRECDTAYNNSQLAGL